MRWYKGSKPFLERIVDFDFEKRYIGWVKIWAHTALWAVYSLIYSSFLHFGEGYTFDESILMTVRVTLLNMTAFYIFFYVLIPYLFNRNYLILFVISTFALIELYLILNRVFYGLILEFGFPIESTPMENLMDRVEQSTVWDAFALNRLFVRTTDLIFTLSPLLFIKITFDLTRTYAKSVRSNRRVETLKREKLKMENKFLNAQLNPHFLFNTLNNLYGLALKKDDLTPELILRLSDIMRYTSYEASADYIPLEKEIRFIEDYVELEKMRFDGEVLLHVDAPNEAIKDLRIAPLLPFVFVENAFKYGLKSDTPFLEIGLTMEGDIFYFRVENDYTPTRIKSEKHRGIGLKNARKRLNLLYPGRHELKITTPENRYCVNLTIHLTKGNQ